MSRNGVIMEVVIPVPRKRARVDPPDTGLTLISETRKKIVVKGNRPSAPKKRAKVESGERVSTSRPLKRVPEKKKRSTNGSFVSLPLEIFNEIVGWSYPSDLLMLTRTTKWLRRTLLRKSAVSIWRSAERNLAEMGMPACPPHITEPEYAVLLFTKNCTMCGTWTSCRPDLYLYVRLCGSCRKTQIEEVRGFAIDIRNLIPCSTVAGPQYDKSGMTHYCLLRDARRIDVERAELVESGNVIALENWEYEKQDDMENRFYHGVKLYDFLRKWQYDEKAERVITERKNFIREKAVAANLPFVDRFDTTHHSLYVLWKTLVEQPKPLTEHGWKSLSLVLAFTLNEIDDAITIDELAEKEQLCARRLSELLLQIGNKSTLSFAKPVATALNIDQTQASAPVALTNEVYTTMLLPFPNLKDALKWSCLSHFANMPHSIESIETTFWLAESRILGEITVWREDVMKCLYRMAYVEARKDQGMAKLTVKGSETPALELSPTCRRLLRADCIFQASSRHPLCSTLRIGASYPVSLPLFFPGLLITRREEIWNSDYFEAHAEARRVATVLLECLGMEDAAHVEMKVMGCRFVCKRCDDRKARDWNRIIGHYLEEQRRHKHVRGSSSFRHGLAQTDDEPMVEMVPAECAGQVLDIRVLVPAKKKARGVRGYRGFY